MYYYDTSFLLTICVFGALLGLIPAAIAYNKGHDFFLWWIFGAAILIIALPASLLIRENTYALEQRKLEQGSMKKCPYCAEIIKKEARICRYCGKELPVIKDAVRESPKPEYESLIDKIPIWIPIIITIIILLLMFRIFNLL